MHQFRFTSLSGSPWQMLRLLSWRGVLALAAAMAALVTIALVAGAALLVLTPIVFVAAMVGRWVMGKRARVATRGEPADLIEGRYEVIEVETPGDGRPNWSR